MDLSVKIEELQKKSIFIATPMYGGMNHGSYMRACLDLQQVCMQHGIKIKFSFLFNESLITRARNYLVDDFLKSDFTHMLFLDSDISFNAMDVLTLLALDYDIVGGPYPKKAIKWSAVKLAVEKNPDVDPQLLETVAGDYVFNMVENTKQFQVGEPLEVREIGTGYMMIKREVFDKFREAYPNTRYKPDHALYNKDGNTYIHAYFDTIIDPDTERYLSEDYMFCQNWRKIGGKIYLCPWMQTEHVGTYAFKGDMSSTAKLVGTL